MLQGMSKRWVMYLFTSRTGDLPPVMGQKRCAACGRRTVQASPAAPTPLDKKNTKVCVMHSAHVRATDCHGTDEADADQPPEVGGPGLHTCSRKRHGGGASNGQD